MKNTLITIIIIAIIAVIASFGYSYYKGESAGSSFDDRNVVTLMGSSGNLTSVPNEAVYANSTTTDEGGYVVEGGATINQLINTGGIRKVWLNISAIGGTATSTFYLQQMGSPDGINYYQIASSTTEIATTSVAFDQKAYDMDPGTATTTISIPIEIDGQRFSRFIFWGDYLGGDDGIQAWITATLVRDKDR